MPSVLMLLDFAPNQHRTFETFLVRLMHALHGAGWRAVYVFSGEPSESFAAELRAANAEYRVASFPLRPMDFDALIGSLSGEPFVAMTTSFISCFSPFILRLKKRLGIRCWIIHDHSSGVASKKWGAKRLLAQLRGFYYGRHIDRVMAVSEFIARRNVEQTFLPKSRVMVLRNGVDLNRFNPSVRRADETRLVFIGQLIPEKGVLTLLRAMSILKQRDVPLTPVLQIAGRGAAEADYRAFAGENGLTNVQFLGQVTDVPALYRAATIVVVPSEWAEAAALVIIEALACGACVLASDAGGNPDLVGRDEMAGRLFRAGDASDLAGKLAELLDDPAAREELQKQARARAERLFDLDGQVRNFVQELKAVTRDD